MKPCAASVNLYWLPLGAGGRSVRWNGRIFEWFAARRGRRARCQLFHSALDVRVGGHRHVVEMAPAWAEAGDHGAVLVGPVGARWLGRSRLFQYEVRRWRDGVIPDVGEAVESPQLVGRDEVRAWQLLDLVPEVPDLTWGRDELNTGEMWNSNSVISWLLSSSGHDLGVVEPPGRGRAPGWHSGLVLAARQTARSR